MTIRPDDVLHVAKLAELEVPDSDLARLTAELDAIVAYVGQLGELSSADGQAAFVAGPAQVALRPDRIDPIPLARPPAAFAPDFRDGFFAVPRLAALDDG
jgi:aspartyl-tRNA(Asn)/glutamyl-tRNA(Gln) amidotransferase subunit C